MQSIGKMITGLQYFFEKLDNYRDKLLFLFIKPCWPRFITPNIISAARICIAFFLFILLFYYKQDGAFIVISLFFLGIATDLLDGSVARGLNKVTKLGTILDPIADRILIVPIAVYSLVFSQVWLLLLILLLELVNASLSAYSYRKHTLIESNIFGKIKMLLHSIVFLGILIYWPKEPILFFIYTLWLSILCMLVSLYIKILQVKNLPH